MVFDRESPLSELARFGFVDLSDAAQNLLELSLLIGPLDELRLMAISKAASPDQALSYLIRLAVRDTKILKQILFDQQAAVRLCRVIGLSEGLADFLDRNWSALEIFLHRETLPDVDQAMALASDRKSLRVQYRIAILRIADFDLAQADFRLSIEPVTEALSNLAANCLEAGLAIAKRELLDEAKINTDEVHALRFAIIGMGKCGARELNYVSDVDVVYVVDSVNESSSDSASVSAADRVLSPKVGDPVALGSKIAARLAQVVFEPGIEPGLFEVDPNLRPEGKTGALVRTLPSHLAYYEKWAESWEFQALLKARFLAGDRQLGLDYEQAVKPLIWSKTDRAEIVENARHLRKRVLDLIPARERDFQIKLGRGGLRDIEFTAQLMQLVHGVTDESLRVMDTLSALDALAQAGLLSRTDRDTFQRHYQTLRAIEHRVQLTKLRRTHLLPNQPDGQRLIARSLGDGITTLDFIELWQQTRLEVAALHDSVFYRPLLGATAALTQGEVRLTPDEVEQRLDALGFRDPLGASRHISALTSGVSRRATIQKTLLPVLLRWMAEGIDPDRALLSFRRLSESLGESHWFLKMLRDSSGAAQGLMTVLSSSGFIARMLEHIPDTSAWFDDESLLLPRNQSDYENEMFSVLGRHLDGQQAAEGIRQVRRRETLRLAIGAVLGRIDLSQISEGLTEIVDSYLRVMLMLAKRPYSSELDICIVAMGRLGGSEIGFGSDADAMLIYQSNQDQAQEVAERITAELLDLVRDPLLPFELDLALRPEGKSGPRIKSLRAYSAYYEKWAEVWEFQALLKARTISGTPELQSLFFNLIRGYRYPENLDNKKITEIRRIKARVEAERLPKGADPLRHFKLGKGSLSDVEWFTQLSQLRFSSTYPELQCTSTLEALQVLLTRGLVPEQDVERFKAAWVMSSRCRNALVLAVEKSSDSLPIDRRQLEAMARIMEYSPGNASVLEESYLAVTRKSRSSFEELFLN